MWKRKLAAAESQSSQPSKKPRKVATAQQNDKGKGRDREFQLVTSSMVLSVAPVFAGNPRAGVEELLDSLVMRYIPALHGVVLSHSNTIFASNTGQIQNDCPYMVCKIKFDASVWNPRLGMKMRGRVNLSSPDHISLLVHRTFNVSIPRHHIPSDIWEFEYGPADNDPEFAEEGENAEDDSGNGRWVSSSTGERLGGKTGSLEFTVIGLTVANEMLSLVGSLQHDPFSPAHKPYTSKSAHRVFPDPHEEEEEDGPGEDFGSEGNDGPRRRKREADAKEELPETKPSKKKRKAKKDKA